MNDIQSNIDNTQSQETAEKPRYTSRRILGEPVVPKMVDFLVNRRIVKKPELAKKVLIGLAVFCFLLAVVLFLATLYDQAPKSAPLNGIVPEVN